MHDEAHDGLEVMSVEGDLALFGHVHLPRMPSATATANSLYTLSTVGRLEGVDAIGEACENVSGYHLQEGGVRRPDLPPRVTQSHQTLGHTPA